jgi:DNA-binding transcriptional ArsR family regulator
MVSIRNDDVEHDRVWRALAHVLRRRVLDVLRSESRTTSELAAALNVTRHQLLVHLSVLRDANLVVTVAEGRIRRNHLNPVPLRLVYDRWLSQYEAVWSDALLGLRADLEDSPAISVQPPTRDQERLRAG